jgi:hypothetical protein
MQNNIKLYLEEMRPNDSEELIFSVYGPVAGSRDQEKQEIS